MDCGMRHGTKSIFKDNQNSLKECMEACGKLAPCQNVDYDKPRKICYYSDHQGPPTISAPGFESAYSMGYEGTCRSKESQSGCCCKVETLKFLPE